MSAKWKTHFVTFRSVIILALLLLVTLAGGMRLLTWASRPLANYNEAYLDTAIRDTAQLMIPVGVAKAAADMIEGSTIQLEAGIVVTKGGMTVEAGDLMQPMLECINIAWNILLASLVCLISAKCLVGGVPELTQPLCAAFLSCYLSEALLAPLLRQQSRTRFLLRKIGGILLLAWLLIILILPLTIAGTAYLTERTTAGMRANVEKTFTRVNIVFSMEGFTHAPEISDKAAYLKQKFADIARYTKEESPGLVTALSELLAIKVLSGVIYPLLMLGFWVWIIRSCLYPVLHPNVPPAHGETKQQEAKALGIGV